MEGLAPTGKKELLTHHVVNMGSSKGNNDGKEAEFTHLSYLKGRTPLGDGRGGSLRINCPLGVASKGITSWDVAPLDMAVAPWGVTS